MIILKSIQYKKVVWRDVMAADFVVLYSRFYGNEKQKRVVGSNLEHSLRRNFSLSDSLFFCKVLKTMLPQTPSISVNRFSMHIRKISLILSSNFYFMSLNVLLFLSFQWFPPAVLVFTTTSKCFYYPQCQNNLMVNLILFEEIL